VLPLPAVLLLRQRAVHLRAGPVPVLATAVRRDEGAGEVKPDLTRPQRAMMRRIIRDEARRLGYVPGSEPRYWPAPLKKFWRAVEKLPVWETPDNDPPFTAMEPPKEPTK
jgi:hypothetical protein